MNCYVLWSMPFSSFGTGSYTKAESPAVKGFQNLPFYLGKNNYSVPARHWVNWYGRIERHTKGLSPSLTDRFNWYRI